MDWKGHRPGEHFTVQGNLLDGPQVVDAMAAAYDPGAGARRAPAAAVPPGWRGGRRRSSRLESAALSIWQEGAAYGGGLDIGTDLRVDDHVAPITELGRLLDLHFLYFERPDPDTLLPIEGALAGEVADALATVGYPPGDYGSLDDAFAAWSGVNNYEERTLPGQLDPIVWAILQEQAARGHCRPMTYSIAAFDAATTQWGVAVASKAMCVGAHVPWGAGGVGAVATQAYHDLRYGYEGLQALHKGSFRRQGRRRADHRRSGERLPPARCRRRRRPGGDVHRASVHAVGRRVERRLVGRPGQHPRRAARRRGDGGGLRRMPPDRSPSA